MGPTVLTCIVGLLVEEGLWRGASSYEISFVQAGPACCISRFCMSI